MRLQALLEWEIEQDVIDRFKLLSFGLKRRAALIRRISFVKAVARIKSRLRRVLSMYLNWKAEKRFRQLEDLINNFDKETVSQPASTQLCKPAKKRVLDVV